MRTSTMHRFRLRLWVAAIAWTAPAHADSGPGWPMRGGDPANSGVSSNCGAKKGVSAWTYQGLGVGVPGHPTVGPDGTVYVCAYHLSGSEFTYRGELWALAPDGTERWHVRMSDSGNRNVQADSPPLIGAGGHIYVGWGFGTVLPSGIHTMALLAFDGSGQLLWRFEPQYNGQTTGGAQPIRGPNDTIIIPISVGFPNTERASLLAIDGRTGQLKWRFRNPRMDAPQRSPAIGNGRVYYQTRSFFESASLFCLNAETGEQIWEVYPISGGVNLPTVETRIDGQEFLYSSGIVSYDTLTKLDANGAVVWDYYPSRSHILGAAVVREGRVYLPIGNNPYDPASNGLHVLDARTGELLAILGATHDVRSAAVDRKGNIFFQGDENVLAYSRAGDYLWEAYFHSSSFTTVAIGRDGLILGSAGSRVYAYKSVLARGDMDCDGTINQFDVQPFITALADPQTYEEQYRFCSLDDPADVNNDGSVNLFDIQPFVELLNP